MIDAIIFDFGDVFINIDKEHCHNQLKKLGLKEWNSELDILNHNYEIGKIDEIQFMEGLQKHIPNASVLEIRDAWNTVLKDFSFYVPTILQTYYCINNQKSVLFMTK